MGVNLFNETYYLRMNPDVAEAVARGLMTAQEHFDLYGKFENRSPSPFFDPSLYLRANPDVAEAVSNGFINAFEHFMSFGMYEGRAASNFFNPSVYATANSDVSAAVAAGMFKSMFEHFLLHGQYEPRNTAAFFDLKGYLDANPDVAEAVRSGHTTGFDHFINHGYAEGRKLGNGIDLAQFASDLKAQAAIRSGDYSGLMDRVAEVAPFLPSFVAPQGYTTPKDTPLPADFTPVGDGKLVVPPGVDAPAVLPPNFEQPAPEPKPNPGGGGGGGTPPVDPLVAAFNAATKPAGLIALIRAHKDELGVAENLALLPESGGRIDAVGAGVKEVWDLFGDFATVDQIKTAVENHVRTELNKKKALDSLYLASLNEAGFVDVVKALASDRAEIISYYSSLAAATNSKAGHLRVDALEEELYTVALAGLATALADPDKAGSIFTQFQAVRGGYDGSIVTLVNKLYAAHAKADPDVKFLHAVNTALVKDDAASVINVLAAIKADEGFAIRLGDEIVFPDGQGREKAVALGVIETIQKLGYFSDVAEMKKVIELHIDMEKNKADFIAGAQVAQDSNFVTSFSTMITTLAQDRTNIISFWSNSKDPQGADRAGELEGDNYTVVLNQIVDHATARGDSEGAYWSSLATAFDEINETYTGSVVTLIGQLQMAHTQALMPEAG